MGLISPTLPTPGDPRGTEEADVGAALQTILNAINGGLDAANLTAAFQQQLGVNPTSLLEIPQLLTAVDMVPLIFVGVREDLFLVNNGGGHGTGRQAAALVYLPRRIVGATKIRWKYHQDASTAWVGNYALGLFDRAGTKIVDTGSVAAAGAADSYQVRAENIAATTFEAGMYYGFFGMTGSAGQAEVRGAFLFNDASGGASPSAPNIGLRATTGGVTVPANILALADVGALTSDTAQGVPQMFLSVG